MIIVVGFSGSLRQGSYNAALLRAAGSLMPSDSELRIESIAGIPLYDGDDEAAHGVPDLVSRLKDAIIAADGLLLVTPEYNNSIPGVAKNAIDWLSRPPRDIARVFGGKPVAIAGASPGGFGTILSQNAWLPVFRTLGADLWSGGRLLVSRAGGVIDANGEISDTATRDNIRRFMEGFVAYVRGRKQSTS
ncbi:MAG TPA: NADPH-dependent FMN reductase [Gemmatimonadaceae bacterium]|nr:NADPH-dependent FMN reductase [Gemmatimonadaceae bacterium]